MLLPDLHFVSSLAWMSYPFHQASPGIAQQGLRVPPGRRLPAKLIGAGSVLGSHLGHLSKGYLSSLCWPAQGFSMCAHIFSHISSLFQRCPHISRISFLVCFSTSLFFLTFTFPFILHFCFSSFSL